MTRLLLLFLFLTFSAFASDTCQEVIDNLEVNSETARANIDAILAVTTQSRSFDVTLSGEITEGKIDRVINNLRTQINREGIFHREITLKLDSTGGNVNEAIRLHRFITEANRLPHVTINTRVGSRDTCESACTIVFTAGERRIAARRARFGFHSPNYVRGNRGGRTASQIEAEYRERWMKYIEDVDQESARRIRDLGYMDDDEMEYMTPLQLNSGYVTEVV